MYAAIDLGTNTFHMIIVDVHNGRTKVVFRKRHFVKLAYESFDEIDSIAIQRGINAILDFKKSMDRYHVTKYRAYGTSIFRRAKNGKDFIELLENKSGLNIAIISGSEEAKLIFYGAKMAGTLGVGKNLIIDIGGGSVEFILTDGDRMLFENSYQIGILELYHRFEAIDTHDEQSLNMIEDFLMHETKDLQESISGLNMESLVGTAGSFDVLRSGIKSKQKGNSIELNIADFKEIFKSIEYTSYEDRLKISWIPRERKKLIVFAFAIIDFALKISGASLLRVTSYSMKEGMIWEMLNEGKIK